MSSLLFCNGFRILGRRPSHVFHPVASCAGSWFGVAWRACACLCVCMCVPSSLLSFLNRRLCLPRRLSSTATVIPPSTIQVAHQQNQPSTPGAPS